MTIDNTVNERLFQEQVMKWAKQNEWKVFHVSPSQPRPGVWKSDGKGFPDLVLTSMREPSQGCLFVELKTNIGKLSPEQIAYGDYLNRAGMEYHIWRPKDLDTVRERLERGSK